MNRRNFITSAVAGIGTLILTKKSRAMQYYPVASDKKCAVLYGTWCGSTRDAAVWISEGMGGIADVFDVREKPDLTGYDHIIVGTPIRWGVAPQELQDYLKTNQNALKGKIKGLFAVCGNMQRPATQEQITQHIDNNLAKLCGVSGVASHVFLGRVTKILMDEKAAKDMANFDDYDNLKRPECMAFGKKVLDSIQ